MHVWVHSIEKVSTSVSPRMGPAPLIIMLQKTKILYTHSINKNIIFVSQFKYSRWGQLLFHYNIWSQDMVYLITNIIRYQSNGFWESINKLKTAATMSLLEMLDYESESISLIFFRLWNWHWCNYCHINYIYIYIYIYIYLTGSIAPNHTHYLAVEFLTHIRV